MSAITPTGGQTALGTPPVATSGAVVIEGSDAAQATIAGNIVTGTVIGRDPRGAVQLRTQNGVILLHTNARLPPGATVTLQVQPVGAQLQAILLQVTGANGRPVAAGIDPAVPHAPTHATPPAAGPQPTVTVGERGTVTAIVIGSPRPEAQASAQAPVPSTVAPTSTMAAAPGAAPPGPAGLAPATTSLPAPAPATGSPPTTLPATGAPLPGAASFTPGGLPAPGTPAGVAPGAPPAAAGSPTASAAPAIATTTQPAPTATAAAAAPQSLGAGAPASIVTVVVPATPGTVRAPEVASGAPAPVAAAIVPSGAAAPAASLAYAATQAATTHLQPTPPHVDAAHAAAALRSPPSAPLPPGSALEVRVAVDAAIAAAPAGRTPAPGSTQLPATIVGRTPTGQGIVDTPAGRLAVPLPPELAAAPFGTRLVLDVVAWRAAVAHGAPASQGAIEAGAVRPILDAVDAIARAANGRVDPHEVLPRPGPRLAQQLADIAAALATGDVAEWLGKSAVEALERRGQGELVRRLEHELYDAARAAPQSPEWRGLILPFVVGDSLRPLRFYVRQRHERARDKQGTRFVVECNHDALGALQLDGLLHGKRLDLVLRSHAPLVEAMRGDLTALFGDACGAMGYAGTIEFQAVPEFLAMPRAEPAMTHVGVVA